MVQSISHEWGIVLRSGQPGANGAGFRRRPMTLAPPPGGRDDHFAVRRINPVGVVRKSAESPTLRRAGVGQGYHPSPERARFMSQYGRRTAVSCPG